MSEFESFDDSVLFHTGHINESAIRLPQSTSLLIQLADDNEWLEHKVEGYKEIIVRYHGKEHRFTPDEVLRMLYAARAELQAEMIDMSKFMPEGQMKLSFEEEK